MPYPEGLIVWHPGQEDTSQPTPIVTYGTARDAAYAHLDGNRSIGTRLYNIVTKPYSFNGYDFDDNGVRKPIISDEFLYSDEFGDVVGIRAVTFSSLVGLLEARQFKTRRSGMRIGDMPLRLARYMATDIRVLLGDG